MRTYNFRRCRAFGGRDRLPALDHQFQLMKLPGKLVAEELIHLLPE
jgi:hypothetical protein